MAHGFAGTRDVALPFVAEQLARAGIAAFVFDYRYFGASGGLPRQIVDPWSQIEDWHAALRFVRARPDVDGTRVALWASSMGAGHALIVAAEDPNLRAVVGQAPLIDTDVEGDATFYGVAWVVRLVLTGWADLVASAFGRDPILLAAIAPRGSFGMIIDDTAYGAFEKLATRGSSYYNGVAARSTFMFDGYNPADGSAEIKAPVLMIASRTDRFAPFAAVQDYADRADNVTIETFDGDHFDVYSLPAIVHAADAATRFLTTHLGAHRDPP
jgi:pimeloyl-ACP methyl ester carboxylesterase